MALVKQLIAHEGLKLKPYRDTTGHLSIGVGRNLDVVGISKSEALQMLDTDINRAVNAARVLMPTFDKLSLNRQAVIVDMAFNLGRGGLAKFRKFRAAVAQEDYATAANEMIDSRWAKQVGLAEGQRAHTLVAMMLDDVTFEAARKRGRR